MFCLGVIMSRVRPVFARLDSKLKIETRLKLKTCELYILKLDSNSNEKPAQLVFHFKLKFGTRARSKLEFV